VDLFTMPAIGTIFTRNYAITCRQWRVTLDNGAGPGPVAASAEVLLSSIGGGT